jgi:hypothetical protein
MTKEIISDIVAAEGKACEIIEKAQSDAREAALISLEEQKVRQEKEINSAKDKAKQILAQKKEDLKNETAGQIQSNKNKYAELQKEAALKMDEAANFIAERIQK